MKKIRLFAVLGLGALSIASLASCGNKEKDAKEYENGELKVAIPTGVIRTAGDIIGLEKVLKFDLLHSILL